MKKPPRNRENDAGRGDEPQRPAAERAPAPPAAPALSERQRVEGPALSERQRVEGPALSERQRVEGPVLSERQRVEGPALSERQRVEGDEEIAAFMSDPELGRMFVTDAVDLLGTIEAVVLQLENSPGDVKLLNDLFRPFHTVKGNAGALGFMSIQAVAHKVETLLDLARSGQHALGPAEVDVVLKAVDLLTVMVQELAVRVAGGAATDFSARRQDLMDAVDRLIAGGSPDPTPPAEHDASQAASAPASGAPAGHAGSGSAESALWEDPTPRRRWDDAQSTVKVNTEKLDSVVDLVGELVIAHAILTENPAIVGCADDRLNRQLAQIKRITSELQRQAMSMRMVPIRQTFQKMARLVRDLSHQSGKAVELVLTGEDTELDRKVVEHLTDPLMHMVRNTLDHGIEAPEIRAAAGKPAQARLRLSAFHQAGAIVIEVADDGAGLDTAKILKKAVATGLIHDGDALSPAEIHQLIFQPGFSTADRVTELSGRGVGMDVVRRNIEALRGRIEIQTAAGQGTTFTLRLPLTLATVDGLLLTVGGERFVIPTFAVRESLRPSAPQLHTIRGRACVMQLRDRLIPVLRLGDVFNIARARQDVTEGTAVVIEENGRQAALVVDDLIGKQEVVIKTLGEPFQSVRGVAGGAILGDGRIGLILDAGGLLSLVDHTAMPAVA